VQSGFVTLTVLQKPYFIAATQAGLTTIFGEGIDRSDTIAHAQKAKNRAFFTERLHSRRKRFPTIS
ncbi:hypothetical protein, partial [Armatimonas sp.]|uniref:hypothetical protein n=1 Tax=Armatimonas sp. TaxID=1872638 RepID=UPI00374C8FA4